MYYDRKHDFALEQVGEAATAEAGAAGGALGGLGAGGEDAGLEDLAAEAAPEGGEEAAPEEEAGSLLATPGGEGGAPAAPPAGEPEEMPPGFRDSKDKFGRPLTTTSKSKSKWYRPTSRDDRSGGTQAMLAAAGMHSVGRSKKSIWPGKDYESIYRGLSEANESNYYDQQEKEIFRESRDIKKLIDSLEKNADET